MNITGKLATLLHLIEDSLLYLKPEENRVVLSEAKILKQGLDRQEIKSCLKYLSDNNFAQNEIAYASEETQSTNGVIYATHTSTRTSKYSQVDYILHINRKKINPLILEAKKILIKTKVLDKKYSHLIEKDTRGNYFYDGKKIEISKEPFYYIAFDTLFSDGDQDGFLSYKDFEKQFLKKDVVPAQDDLIRNKRINNALINGQNGFFRYAKINGKQLMNKTLDGKKLIEIIRGQGLRLNNQKI
ncbi:MAG TPA: hypothetical protein VJG67_03885 [Candidatus Paceibacterota bacterium]